MNYSVKIKGECFSTHVDNVIEVKIDDVWVIFKRKFDDTELDSIRFFKDNVLSIEGPDF